mgnify:CR=1 FL=1
MGKEKYTDLLHQIEREEYLNTNLADICESDEELVRFNYRVLEKQIRTLLTYTPGNTLLQNLLNQIILYRNAEMEYTPLFGILESYMILGMIEKKLYKIARVLDDI